MFDINLKDSDESEEVFARNVNLRIGDKSLEGYQISKKSTPSSNERRTYLNVNNCGIVECSKSITLTELREIDGDRDKLNKFTRDINKGHPNDVSVSVIRLTASLNKINSSDIDFLAQLTTMSKIDMIVPPFISLPKEEIFDFTQYSKIISSFFEVVENNYNISGRPVCCPIPITQISRKNVKDLIDLHDNRSQLYFFDFFGCKPLSSDNEIILKEALKNIKKVEDGHNGGSFVYGYDVSPSPKGGSFCEAQILSSIGVNAVGPKRKRLKMPVSLLDKMKGQDPLTNTKIFCEKDYTLLPAIKSQNIDGFNDFVKNDFDLDIYSMDKTGLGNCANAYNYYKRVEDIPKFVEAIHDNKTMSYLTSKNTPNNVVKIVNKVAKEVRKKD